MIGMNDAQRMQQTGGVNPTRPTDVEHWKYPETVGNDTKVDDINFNSNDASEYAIRRMNKISETTHEPFVMFEFMKVDNVDYGSGTANAITKVPGDVSAAVWKNGQNIGTNIVNNIENVAAAGAAVYNTGKDAIFDTENSVVPTVLDTVKDWAKSIGTLVKRKYTGSIALYMPTDIQINDQMIYNEDSRKMGALAETLFSGNYTDAFNPTTLTSSASLATIGFLGGKAASVLHLGGGAGVMSALAGAGLAQIAGNEIQRGSGKISNPNEILMYQSTAMRTFSFNWTILPDSEEESTHATGLIKLFRKSAHARKDNLMLITVPDHVIVSFHGAKDMIQLPPCVIESVNVTYNPNSSSFFKENNAPVEIGLAITLKEMAPIYAADVERGY
jgi:hypothetical protein|tara:strand:+ start:47 stop:1210 length:1164 start_codon:yes stop_codon:yes gene_type:complete